MKSKSPLEKTQYVRLSSQRQSWRDDRCKKVAIVKQILFPLCLLSNAKQGELQIWTQIDFFQLLLLKMEFQFLTASVLLNCFLKQLF